jgi:hypothetical protein
MNWLTDGQIIGALSALLITSAAIFGWAVAGIRRLDRKIQTLGDKLSARFDELDEKLSRSIDSLDEKCSAQLDEVEAKLSRRIDNIDARLSARLEALSIEVLRIEGAKWGRTPMDAIHLPCGVIVNMSRN